MKKEVTTDSGFTCEIDLEKLDDWEFAEAAAAVAESKGGAETLRLAVFIANHMMEAEDAARLKEHVKTESGRVPTSRMMEEIFDLMNKVKAKN